MLEALATGQATCWVIPQKVVDAIYQRTWDGLVEEGVYLDRFDLWERSQKRIICGTPGLKTIPSETRTLGLWPSRVLCSSFRRQ